MAVASIVQLAILAATLLTLSSAPAGGADIPLPLPPTPAQFEPYGLAGLIFATGAFFAGVILLLGWKLLSSRDTLWATTQEKKDAVFASSLKDLTLSHEKVMDKHEKVMDKVAVAVERMGESSTIANREMTQAMRDLQSEVKHSAQSFGETTLYGIFRKVLTDVEKDRRSGASKT